MTKDQISIPINDKAELIITPQAVDKPILYEIDKEEAYRNAESPYQLIEGFTYDWEIINEEYHLEVDKNIVFNTSNYINRGVIKPNIFVGTLSIPVFKNSTFIKTIEIEVRSLKASYRKDYRQMLTDISEYCTDLLMQTTSPASQQYTVDHDNRSETLYQKFSFVKSIIDSDEFEEAIYQITELPNSKWEVFEEEQDIRRVGRITNKIAKRFVKVSNRIPINDELLKRNFGSLNSLPKSVSLKKTRDTVDTIENQFIKFVLETFLFFCEDLKPKLAKKKNRFNKEINQVIYKLEDYLQHNIFRDISQLKMMPLNNPLLQRKGGYKEVYKSWLMFDLAAKLFWKGGDDVYRAGKRDVATLYEYWVFFALLEIIKQIFEIKKTDISSLISDTKDGLGLQLKQGVHTALEGKYISDQRELNIKFSFNRTFSRKNKISEEGSWTKQMRPDYTITLWPSQFSEKQAIVNDLITHIHFDAKYKIANITQLLGSDSEDDFDESSTYKRVDLLKMHAYKDAIRRSSGAYVIYPGKKESDKIRSFHEILPGLGAFPLRPTRDKQGLSEIKLFIKDVIKHYLDRTSQRGSIEFHKNRILKGGNKKDVLIKYIPELQPNNKLLIPSETNVIIGYYKNDNHLAWILETWAYNIRADAERNGGMQLSPQLISAKYILLHNSSKSNNQVLLFVTSNGPKVQLKSQLDGYPSSDGKDHQYFVFDVEKVINTKFQRYHFDIKELAGFTKENLDGCPYVTTLEKLFSVSDS
ncbi:DUF2357 domain-containing protein [Flammeovirga kamogawensis]|uniref:DUF2357 domain-containing protein n=1 Tax=Flammeovirga kamogawensis TaxID=373891 RepID=A0ABX8H3S2_9BACT|nr:DUF2357 domain-containing protein [Flammeovirga kamogawensis]MBB6460468.1 hypothetical protein [Flammeovirga kamogawensis]QWG10274.1 DUF2357 domain-containing protein [Flammeovirga kamogawensis]TRX64722.1 DUF2357 domain-containing protein [Flammeovirga kamogawensis]